ncbi:MAG TPA: hypothetical protein VKR56_15200 [Candidatus Cybelea sp.]|nr:hypothetical protein [Candidatus Cybelea sp.]
MRIAGRRLPVAALAAVLLLAGCGGSHNGLPVASGGSALTATSGDLLYVANRRASDGVSVLTFPQGKFVAKITSVGLPQGICSDAAGNVWIGAYDSSRRASFFYEFAHGGTKPIETLQTRDYIEGCAVDPATGDLAGFGSPRSAYGDIEIWPGARQGKPIVHKLGFEPTCGGFDDSSNFFVDGVLGSTFNFILAELPNGGGKVRNIQLSKFASFAPGSVQWDGKYMSIGVLGLREKAWQVYRFQVSGTTGKVVGVVHLRNLAVTPRYWIAGNEIVATQRATTVRHLGLYDYPAGGQRIELYSSFYDPAGVTVSVPPT